jgi:hypothetical protein
LTAYLIQAHSIVYDSANDQYLVYGDYFETDQSPRRNFLLEVRSDFSEQRITTFGCKDFSQYGGCNVFAKQVFALSTGKKILINEKHAYIDYTLTDPGVLILDSNSQIENNLWFLKSDTFCLLATKQNHHHWLSLTYRQLD